MDALTMTAEVQRAIASHAREEYPRECCGILLGTRASVHIALRANNIAPADRLRDRYVIDPLAILRADTRARGGGGGGLEIVGFYHSHPDHQAVPSAADVALAWADYVYVIVTVTEEHIGETRAWHFETGENTLKRELRVIIED